MVTDKYNSKRNYFLPVFQQEVVKRVSVEITQQLHREFLDVFMCTGCFNGTLS